ncbi:MAG: hypothetical protein ABR516_05165 [Desulfuromonadaceae bacterium]
MSKDATYETQRCEIDNVLQLSIEQYSAMLVLLEQIAAAVAEDEGNVKTLVGKLKDQQRQIEEIDADLNTRLEGFLLAYPDVFRAYPLFEKRLKIISEVKQMNDLLLPKISGIMSLISHEIGELKGGRNAISGYRAQGKSTSSKRHYTA